MPCEDCFDFNNANTLLGLKNTISTALVAMCDKRCIGQLTTPELEPLSNAAGSISEGFPDGLPACECALLILKDTEGVLYFSADNGITWKTFPALVNNNISIINPTVTDDSNQNYSIGSRWINIVTQHEYVCVDNTVGAAVWMPTTGGFLIPPALTTIVPPTVLGANAATIVISDIPANYRDLVLEVRGRTTAGGAILNMRFNGDSGDNYAFTYTARIETSPVFIASSNVSNAAVIAGVALATDSAGAFAHAKIEIFDYAKTAMSRNGNFEASRFFSTGAPQRGKGVFAWENLVDAISSITLYPSLGSGGEFLAGTTYALYGRGQF